MRKTFRYIIDLIKNVSKDVIEKKSNEILSGGIEFDKIDNCEIWTGGIMFDFIIEKRNRLFFLKIKSIKIDSGTTRSGERGVFVNEKQMLKDLQFAMIEFDPFRSLQEAIDYAVVLEHVFDYGKCEMIRDYEDD